MPRSWSACPGSEPSCSASIGPAKPPRPPSPPISASPPQIRAELPGVGTLVTEFVGGTPATTEALLEPGVLERVTEFIRRLHASGPIAASFPIFRVVEWHARDAAANGVDPPAVYDELREAARAIEAVFDPRSLESTLCHNDLLPANVLLAADRLWIIDYEYAGMNHARVRSRQPVGQLRLRRGGRPPTAGRVRRRCLGERLAQLALMKVMSEMREGMWAVVQQAISTLTHVDFVEYAATRLDALPRAVRRSAVRDVARRGTPPLSGAASASTFRRMRDRPES